MAFQRILCKRFSTKSGISHYQCVWLGLILLGYRFPGRLGRYARLTRRECRHGLPGILMQGDQPTFRSANMISNWLSTRSQFWHLACQSLTIRCFNNSCGTLCIILAPLSWMFRFILDFAASIYIVIRCRLHRFFCGLILIFNRKL